jgi:hypothetical protein
MQGKIRIPKSILLNENQEIVKQSKDLYSINDFLFDVVEKSEIIEDLNDFEPKLKKKQRHKIQRLNTITNEIKIYKGISEAVNDNNLSERKIYRSIHKEVKYNDYIFCNYSGR